MQPDRAGVEAGDLEQILDQPLEPATSPTSRSRAAWARSGISSRRACITSTDADSVISGERSSWLTSDANRASRSTRCCRADAISLNDSASTLQVGVVGRLEARVEAAAGDRLGGLGRVAERAHGAPRREHAEQDAEQRW